MMGEGSFTYTPLPENVTVGKYSSIARDCRFHDGGTHLYEKNKKVVFTINWDQIREVPPIIIGNDVWLGEGVRVLTGVTIGDGVIVGAGAVISKDIPPFAVVVGNSQRIVRFRFTPEQIALLQKIKWWDWPEPLIRERIEDMKDISVFLKKYYVSE